MQQQFACGDDRLLHKNCIPAGDEDWWSTPHVKDGIKLRLADEQDGDDLVEKDATSSSKVPDMDDTAVAAGDDGGGATGGFVGGADGGSDGSSDGGATLFPKAPVLPQRITRAATAAAASGASSAASAAVPYDGHDDDASNDDNSDDDDDRSLRGDLHALLDLSEADDDNGAGDDGDDGGDGEKESENAESADGSRGGAVANSAAPPAERPRLSQYLTVRLATGEERRIHKQTFINELNALRPGVKLSNDRLSRVAQKSCLHLLAAASPEAASAGDDETAPMLGVGTDFAMAFEDDSGEHMNVWFGRVQRMKLMSGRGGAIWRRPFALDADPAKRPSVVVYARWYDYIDRSRTKFRYNVGDSQPYLVKWIVQLPHFDRDPGDGETYTLDPIDRKAVDDAIARMSSDLTAAGAATAASATVRSARVAAGGAAPRQAPAAEQKRQRGNADNPNGGTAASASSEAGAATAASATVRRARAAAGGAAPHQAPAAQRKRQRGDAGNPDGGTATSASSAAGRARGRGSCRANGRASGRARGGVRGRGGGARGRGGT